MSGLQAHSRGRQRGAATMRTLLMCVVCASAKAHPNLLPGLRRLGLGTADNLLPALKQLGVGTADSFSVLKQLGVGTAGNVLPALKNLGDGLSHTFRLRGGDDTSTKGPSGIWDSAERKGVSGAQFAILDNVQADSWDEKGYKRRSQAQTRFVVNCSSVDVGTTTLFVEGSWGADSSNLVDVLRIPLTTTEDSFPLWTGEANLKPGVFLFNYMMIQTEENETVVKREECDPREMQIFPSADPHAIMLATDLDGTVVGDTDSCEAFFRVWGDEYHPRGCKLVYNTGRPFDSAMRLINKGEIERPAVLVCSEGTQVFWFEPGADTPVLDVEWQQKLNNSWDYDGLVNLTAALHAEHKDNITNYVALAHNHGQPMIVLAVSSRETTETIVGALMTEGRELRGLQFDLIQSSSGHEWYVLVVPPGAGKGSAALHCAARFGFEPPRVMVSGDGENDIPLFESMAAGTRGALVGNAVPGLRQWVNGSGKAGAYVIAERSHARGILDGLKHHFSSLGYTHAKDILDRTDGKLVKVSVGSDTRLVRAKAPLSFADLVATIRARFEMPQKLDIKLRYMDVDGDLITLASEEDAAEVETSVSTEGPLRVVVLTSWAECWCCGKNAGSTLMG